VGTNLIGDAGAPCGAGGGGGTPGGVNLSMQYNNAGAFAGVAPLPSSVFMTNSGSSPILSTTFPTGLSIPAADIGPLGAFALVGNPSGVSGQAAEIGLGTCLTIGSSTLNVGCSFSDISGQAALSQLPSIANNTVLGNVSGGITFPQAITPLQLTALCQTFTSSLSGCVPASGGGSTNFLRADGTWATPPGTMGTVTSVNLTAPGWLTVTGTPITTAGTIAITSTSETANYALMSPNGSPGAMTPRAIVAADLPLASNSTLGIAQCDVLSINCASGIITAQFPVQVAKTTDYTVLYTGSGYTTGSDADTQIPFNCGSPCTATMPQSTTGVFPTGTAIAFINYGAANLTISPLVSTIYGVSLSSGKIVLQPYGSAYLTADASHNYAAEVSSGYTGSPTTALTDTHIFVGNGSNVATDVALSQDCTMADTGAITCTKTNNVAFGTAATVNTGTSGATIPLLNGTNTYSGASSVTAAFTFSNSDIKELGSSTGVTTITSANSGSSNFTITLPAATDTMAGLTAIDQALSGGFNVTPPNQGTKSSGTYTPDCGAGPLQYFTNGGAFILAAPSSDGECTLYDLNNGSAGTITFSGFTVGANTGDALTNTNTSKFFIQIQRVNSVATYSVRALQ